MKKHIPNILTCLNLFCGCIATVLIFHDHLVWAAYVVCVAAFFDLLDGMIARALNVQSPIGKELDSLADVISFGLVPGAIMFMLFQKSDMKMLTENEFILHGLKFFPFIITIFSALRLAKFNIDTRQTDSFIGLPTPANTILIISLPLILADTTESVKYILLHPYLIVFLCMIQSYLLIAELPLISFKFKSLAWSANSYQYLLLVLSVAFLFFLKFAALPLIIFFYVLLSVFKNLLTKNNSIK